MSILLDTIEVLSGKRAVQTIRVADLMGIQQRMEQTMDVVELHDGTILYLEHVEGNTVDQVVKVHHLRVADED